VAVAFVCPRCLAPLSNHDDSVTCTGCGAAYRAVDGVPLLISDQLSEQQQFQLRYFEAEFSEYDSYALENWRLSYIERIFGATGVLEGRAPYLDLGVGGSGATVIEAARRGVPAIGVDLSPSGVLAARGFARREGVDGLADFAVCAAEAVPLPDASVGSASAVALLEHLDDDRAAVAELARVLKPGARVWLMVPHAFRYMPPPVWPLYWWHDRRIGHKRHYDEARLVRLGEEHGLEHVSTSYSAHPVKLLQAAATKLLPSLRQARSRSWWRLEELDRRASSRRWGALHLNAVFRRRS
jgi:SAM-dependent methyltransferase